MPALPMKSRLLTDAILNRAVSDIVCFAEACTHAQNRKAKTKAFLKAIVAEHVGKDVWPFPKFYSQSSKN